MALNCKFCNKELKNQGAINLHELKCKDNPKNKETKKDDDQGPKCLEGLKHQFKLLNPKVLLENKAIKAGYTEVCKHCQELR